MQSLCIEYQWQKNTTLQKLNLNKNATTILHKSYTKILQILLLPSQEYICVLGVSLKGGRQCIIVSITIKYSILLQYHSITMKRHRNFVVFTKTHLCAWSINEGWLAVMTPSGEKTPPQQQNWQRGRRGE